MTFLFLLIVCFLSHGEGFSPETLVKVPTGYCAIGSLKINDLVVCYDAKTDRQHVRPIISISRIKRISYITYFSSSAVNIGHNQLIYISSLKKWVPIQEIFECEYTSRQTDITRIIPSSVEELIVLCVADFHNFYITEYNALVHNFVPIVFVATATESIIPLIVSSGVLATCMTYLGIDAFREHKKKKQIEHNKNDNEFRLASGGAGRPPDDPNDAFKNNDNERFNRRDPDHHITNKEAREVATQLGYVQVKNPPFNTHGQLAFKKGTLYITPDNTSHKGGYWKLVQVIGNTVTRLGTYDQSLKRKIGA